MAHHNAGNAQCASILLDGAGETDAAGRGAALIYRDFPQGVVLVGATVAVTVYAVYRLGARRKWWPLVGFRRGVRGGGNTNIACDRVNAEVEQDEGERDMNQEVSRTDGCSDSRSTGHADGDDHPSNGSVSLPDNDGSPCSNSRTEELLAEADALIGADPPQSPAHNRRISNDEIDALVDLTHRVLARDPVAISEIADDAASIGDLSDVGSPQNPTSNWDGVTSSDGATPRTPRENNHASAGRAPLSTLR